MPRCFMSALAKLGGSQEEEEEEEEEPHPGQQQELGLWPPVEDCLHRI